MLLFVGGGENATPNSPPQASLSQAGLWAGCDRSLSVSPSPIEENQR
ncbi:hypothetical protein [Nostoc sp. ATCC 53789]|nr:hypothetical protein [Nostoc sp. ATCC 53789]QHG20262.1 hypothetical protein GJB62_30420 [Nostoc sp. ATCC 53789]